MLQFHFHLQSPWKVGISPGFSVMWTSSWPGGWRKIGEGPFAAARGGIFVWVSGQGETVKRGAATESCDICIYFRESTCSYERSFVEKSFNLAKRKLSCEEDWLNHWNWTRFSFCSTQMIQIQMISLGQALHRPPTEHEAHARQWFCYRMLLWKPTDDVLQIGLKSGSLSYGFLTR